MITVISTTQINNKTYFVLQCEICNNHFNRLKTWVDFKIKNDNIKNICCCKKCTDLAKIKEVVVECFLCKKYYKKHPCDAKRGKHSFCSASCRSIFNNKNKICGSTRSKLEKFIENKIKEEFSDILFKCNDNTTIGSELDFYFPDLKCAIEINGITHYKPIYGQNKYSRIKLMDKEKKKLCKKYGIHLFIINCSKDKKNDKISNEKHWQKINKILFKMQKTM